MTSIRTSRVLVTGGAGFIGCALSQQLAHDAEQWVVLDSLHPQVHAERSRPDELHPAAELIVGDVTEPTVWDDVLANVRPDVIVHLAAETGTAQSLDEASRHSRVNVVGTTEMTDALGRHGVLPAHVVLSSSRAVYGEGVWRRSDGSLFAPGQRSHAQFEARQWDFPDATPIPSRSNETVPAPTSVYGATKYTQELVLRAWGAARGVPVSILRLQNVYGPGQSLTNPYTGIVSLFSRLARDGEVIPLYEDGQIVRDFVYIDDVADAFMAILAEGPRDGRPVVDVGSGVATTIEQLAREIAAYHGAPTPVVNGRYRDGDVRYAACVLDPDALGWVPRWSLTDGVASLQRWIADRIEEHRIGD